MLKSASKFDTKRKLCGHQMGEQRKQKWAKKKLASMTRGKQWYGFQVICCNLCYVINQELLQA